MDLGTAKSCCASLYSSEWARLLLGDSFHPGGLTLTDRLADLVGLRPGMRVLDLASGAGTTALRLADRYGCEVVGVDFGSATVARCRLAAQEAGLATQVRFCVGDAERLAFADGSFDAVICECAFCTFVDKPTAAAEIARVLAPDGRLGLSDLTRNGPLPAELEGLLAWVACVADALPVEQYAACFRRAGLSTAHAERHDEVLAQMVEQIRAKLFGAELVMKVRRMDIPGVDLAQAKSFARSAAEAVRAGQLGYAIVVARKLPIATRG
jgi:ubiquinone/menaquinone biosynthesis C-methylase UbiE